MIGKRIIWHKRPINTALGKTKTLLKSSIFKDNPNPIMMTPSARGNKTADKKLACMVNYGLVIN